jgi:hypothetical protein
MTSLGWTHLCRPAAVNGRLLAPHGVSLRVA